MSTSRVCERLWGPSGPELRACSRQGRLCSPELPDVFSEGCSPGVLRKKAPFGSTSGAPPCPSRAGRDGASTVRLALSRGHRSPPGQEGPVRSGAFPRVGQSPGGDEERPLSGPSLVCTAQAWGSGTGGRRGPAEAVDGPQHLEWPGEHQRGSGAREAKVLLVLALPLPLLLPPCPPGCAQALPSLRCVVPRARRQACHQLREEPLCLIRLVLRLHVRHRLHCACFPGRGQGWCSSKPLGSQPAPSPRFPSGHIPLSFCLESGCRVAPQPQGHCRIRPERGGCRRSARVRTHIPVAARGPCFSRLPGRVRERTAGRRVCPEGPRAPPTGYLGEAPGIRPVA